MAITVEQLVQDNVHGEVRQLKVTEEDGGTLERAGVVLWRNDRGEWGTHRFAINAELDEGMLVWGHYHRGPHAAEDAYKDYMKRIGEDT